MNNVILTGNLVKDVKITVFGNKEVETKKGNFNLAVDRRLKKGDKEAGKQSVDYIPCEVFGRLAEVAEQYTTMGDKVLVKGELRIDRPEGSEKTYTKVIVNELELVENKNRE